MWASIEDLKNYTYKTAHAEMLRDRKDCSKSSRALPGHVVGTGGTHPRHRRGQEAPAHLDVHGPSQFAFTFKTVQPPDESWLSTFDVVFTPCLRYSFTKFGYNNLSSRA